MISPSQNILLRPPALISNSIYAFLAVFLFILSCNDSQKTVSSFDDNPKNCRYHPSYPLVKFEISDRIDSANKTEPYFTEGFNDFKFDALQGNVILSFDYSGPTDCPLHGYFKITEDRDTTFLILKKCNNHKKAKHETKERRYYFYFSDLDTGKDHYYVPKIE